jgi:uncharacterized lipoprotein
MRLSILVIALVAILALTGCGSQSQTRAEYESDHPYAKKAWELPPSPERMGTTVQYVDHVPTMDFNGNNYRRIRRIDTNVYDAQGRIISRERREE